MLLFAIAFQILTNVAMTTADANTSVRTNLETTSVTVYRDMTSIRTAKPVLVTCPLICENVNQYARTRLAFVHAFKISK